MTHLEQRYWNLTKDLWSSSSRACRRVMGDSFGCRIAFAFAARFGESGCFDVRVVLLDGRVASQPFFEPASHDAHARAVMDATRAKVGDELFEDTVKLNQLRIDDRQHAVLSERVHILYVASQETMGLPRVRKLTPRSNLWEVSVPGLHFEALQHISKGQPAHEMGVLVDYFLA